MTPPNPSREAAFEALFRDHVDAVRTYLHRRVPGVADDLVAETFLVAWRRFDAVPAEPLPWLLGVARNLRLNADRSGRRDARLVARVAAELPATGELAERPPLAAALARLSERDRELLLLVAWEGLDNAAVGLVLGITRSTVAVRLHRARRRLARELSVAPDGSRRSFEHAT